jgi:DNA repair protein RadC
MSHQRTLYLERTDAVACRLMRIRFLDHVIITDGAYYSYHEEGLV